MITEGIDTAAIYELLKDFNVSLHIESPNRNYRFEYYSTSIKDHKTGEQQLTRSYRLRNLDLGNVTQEPWERFDIDKQTRLITNLLTISEYKIVKAERGWKVTCPTCGFIMEGKIWETVPRICQAKGCKQKVD